MGASDSRNTVEIIAEAAQGFEGKAVQAHLLVLAAATAGADAVKFQLVYADELATADYEHYALFRGLEMADDEWMGVAESAAEFKVQLYLDVFGERSLAMAERLDVPSIKIHGTDIANLGFLEVIARSAVPRVLLGAGGATWDEIASALEVLEGKHVVVLLGFQSYPTQTGDNQIARVRLLTERLTGRENVTLGFADHAMPDTALRVALAATAVGAGASVIEKHITLGRIMGLEDHESALNPDEFADFVSELRGCEAAFGAASEALDFGMSESERNYRAKIRRHVIARRDLEAGARIAPDDVQLKRSSAAAPITDLNAVYGQILNRAVERNEPILMTDVVKEGVTQ